VTRYLVTEKYEIHKAVSTVSNAMDVGNPSNFVRILEILENNFPALNKALSSYSIDDNTTKATIARVYKTYNYTLDPHGAVAFAAAEIYLANLEKNNTSSNAQKNNNAMILETAHPVKFPEVVEEAIGQTISIPDSVKFLLNKKKVSIPIAANYAAFKNWMIAVS
jgi:threonine synthase